MSAITVAGNEIIPDTLTVTVDGTEITAKDFQKVLLNINQASATASVADGTDLMQKMEIINKNANACDVSFTGEGGATVKNLKQNQSMRLSWTGSFWYVTFGGLLSGFANDGTPFNYTTEVTLDEKPVNTVYTTTEQDTGMTWIDGKKIYRLSFTGTPPQETSTYRDTYIFGLDLSSNNLNEVIDTVAFIQITYNGNTQVVYKIGGGSVQDSSGNPVQQISHIGYGKDTQIVSFGLACKHGWWITAASKIYGFIEYTKTTD